MEKISSLIIIVLMEEHHFRCFSWIFYEWEFVCYGKKNKHGKQLL